MSGEKAWVQETLITCPKCGEANRPGAGCCTKCKTDLRPTWLGIGTFLGPIILALQTLVLLNARDAGAVITIAGIVILLSLRYGQYWAWVGLQVFWVVTIARDFIQVLAGEQEIHHAVLRVVVVACLWVYLHTEKVKSFCSVRHGAGR